MVSFDWNVPQPFREIFRARVFDALGRFGKPLETKTGAATVVHAAGPLQ